MRSQQLNLDLVPHRDNVDISRIRRAIQMLSDRLGQLRVDRPAQPFVGGDRNDQFLRAVCVPALRRERLGFRVLVELLVRVIEFFRRDLRSFRLTQSG